MRHLYPVFLILFLTACSRGKNPNDWPVYLCDKSSTHYSQLDEINRGNVGHLKVAWEYHTGDDVSDNHGQIQCNPLIIDGILYGTSPDLKLFALDASTGEELWQFDPDPEGKFGKNVNRGVAFWSDGIEKRIMFSSGPYLYAVDANTGKAVESFGEKGKVSLKEGLGERSADLYVVATSPGIVYKDILIIGSRVSENAGAAPGHIRAFNIRTGELEWIFHTIPQPGEYGYETWPAEAYKTTGGANCWAGMSLDEERGIVYIPTGSAAYDFWGGDRKGENLFANCLLALDAATGKRIWHFQSVHHDIWDRDLPAPPNLVKVKRDGRKMDAVAQITKSGFIFLFDRETGRPLHSIEERKVPPSDLEGEEAWPTQPFSLMPRFSPGIFTEDEITDISSESHEYVKNILVNVRAGEQFIPPSAEGTIIFPGFDGGGEWGGSAVDPEKGIMYVNSSVMPWILTMVRTIPENGRISGKGEQVYRIYCGVCHGTQRQGDPSKTYPSLLSVKEKYTADQILNLINTGKGFMPSFRHLKDESKNALISYLLGKEDLALPGVADSSAVPYTFTGYNRFFDQDGYPAVKPPWGLLTAVDLNEGKILWQVPLGEFDELTKRGISRTGTENYGGPALTAGGLVFIAASKDEYFRAFDSETGKELWKHRLPAGGYATPSVYSVNGREYVVIACGGGKMGTRSGDSYISFGIGE